MEKKKKRVFVLGLVALLSVISIGMILLCRNIQSENQGTQTVDVSAVSPVFHHFYQTAAVIPDKFQEMVYPCVQPL